MNIFQKQLLIDNDKTLAEIHNNTPLATHDDPLGRIASVELPPPPKRISIEEFEADMKKTTK